MPPPTFDLRSSIHTITSVAIKVTLQEEKKQSVMRNLRMGSTGYDIRFDQAERDGHVPGNEGLVTVKPSKFIHPIYLGPCPDTKVFSLCASFRSNTLVLTATAWSKHQCCGCDPEEEDQDFGRQSSNCVHGAAAGEWVRPVVGESDFRSLARYSA